VRPGNGGSLQVVVGPMADSIADEIRLAMPASSQLASPSVAPLPQASTVTPSHAEQWLNALDGADNVLLLDCVAMTRIRLQLADDQMLSEQQLKALGCQGISQLDDGIWHLLVGESAQGLSTALKALASRNTVRTGA
ncbi:PTS N-acetyl-D-glucosamine transporter, partial [Pseudomonas marginalis]